MSRRESSNVNAGNVSRKISKRIEEENHEESEADMHAKSRSKLNPSPEHGQPVQNCYIGYKQGSTNYNDQFKAMFPVSPSSMGMNSIPSSMSNLPYMN